MASSAAPPTSSSGAVPVLQAGGGQPSTLESAMKIENFSFPVLSYLKTIFKTYAGDASLSRSEGTKFLRDIQKEPDTPATLDKEACDQHDFFEYMASPASAAMTAAKHHDHSRPISNYFISTSHNTYLSGNQLYGDASTAAYTNVLARGCRCLEIDVWDGEPKSDDYSDAEEGEDPTRKQSRWGRLKARARSPHRHSKEGARATAPPQHEEKLPQPWRSPSTERRAEPRVLHGHTLTKEISFRAVCNAIADSAFIASDLPIIVSLEVHASLEQQEVMVEIMRGAWKGMLVDVTEIEERDIKHLPSPDQLRRKILIKVKWTTASKTGESNDPSDHVTNTNSSDDETLTQTTTLSSTAEQQKKKKASKILQALSELGVYTRAYSFKHFDQPESKIPTHVYSLSEQKVLDMHDSHGAALFNHNRNYMMRVYPSGLRVTSSNVEPTFLWRQGAQMVALNWQKWDAGMMLNEGMFAGQEGWVLKPQGYHSTMVASSASPNAVIALKHLDLTIEVLAGQSIPLPLDKEAVHFAKFHPYIKAQLHVDNKPVKLSGEESEGERARDEEDASSSKFKRRSRTAKSADPDFLGETFHWSNVANVIEELSFLRIKIQDDKKIGKDDLAAWACIKLDRLQSGYRFIHLLDAKGMPSTGALLVKITKIFS